jgi:hypothetical protein
MNRLYAEMRREEGEKAARNLARKILAQNNGNVTQVAEILDVCTKCIRRARGGPLEDKSRAPKTPSEKQLRSDWEDLILSEREITRYGGKRMSNHLKAKFGIEIPSDTIRNIFRRNQVKKKIYIRSSKASKPLYDYENIVPFEFMQIDTKHIEDFEALGR